MKSHEAAALTSQGKAFGALDAMRRLHARRGQGDTCAKGGPFFVPTRWAFEPDSKGVHGFCEVLNAGVWMIGHRPRSIPQAQES
jgi:hypothetical protein